MTPHDRPVRSPRRSDEQVRKGRSYAVLAQTVAELAVDVATPCGQRWSPSPTTRRWTRPGRCSRTGEACGGCWAMRPSARLFRSALGKGPTVCHQRGEQRRRDPAFGSLPGVSPLPMAHLVRREREPRRSAGPGPRADWAGTGRPPNSGLVPRRKQGARRRATPGAIAGPRVAASLVVRTSSEVAAVPSCRSSWASGSRPSGRGDHWRLV